MPDCAMDTVPPPLIVRVPFLDCELELAATDQLIVLPLADAAAHDTVEPAEGGGQLTELGVTMNAPDPPTAATFRLGVPGV